MNNTEYNKIAENIFAPIYPDIAAAMLERTGVKEGKMLDIGCGSGHMGFAVMDAGDFTGVFCDINAEAVQIAKQRANDLGYGGRVSVLAADVHELPFDASSFDLAISRGSMPFWDDQIKAFREIYRVLKPGGWAYIGGGMGGAKHQALMLKKLELAGVECNCFDRSKSKALSTEAYVELFKALDCPYRVIENSGEGRWFMFGKRV